MRHLLFCGVLCLSAASFADEPLRLVEQGASRYAIVVPAEASAVERSAAGELQQHLAEVSGTELPIVAETDRLAGEPSILIGATRRTREQLPQLDVEQLGEDGVVLKTIGDDLVLAGRPPRGTLYAVYTFLEETLGCRWWTPNESHIPRRPTLDVPPLDVQYAPKLLYRHAFYRDTFNGRFAARLKCNGHHANVPAEYGGHHRFAGFVHTFYPLLPPEKYSAEHPEWYSEINGKRTHQRAQLCLTNDAMRAELTRNALAWLHANPQASFISISQNDWHGRCECDRCLAVEEEEGSAAGPLLRLVNAVAEPIEREFPHVWVETLAYQYTRTPPKVVRPRKNVIVRLCSIECCFAQPLAAGEHNAAFRADIEGWSRVAPRLFVWDYVTNFSNYIAPHPNLQVLGTNIRYFTDHNVVGLFEQGDAGSGVGDFVRMRAWVLAHLMWDPTRNEQALIREFLQGYYGPAAPHLEAYLDVKQQAAVREDVYLRCFMPNTAAWLRLDDMNRATRLYRQAEAAVADDPVLAHRVRRERLPLDHVWLARYYALQRMARAGDAEFLGPDDPQAACEEYIKVAEENGVGQWRERVAFSEYTDRLRRRFRPPGAPPAMCRDLAAEDWIDLQDNQFHLAQPGKWAAVVDDAVASDGKAARMGGDHYEWAVSFRLTDDLADAKAWRCFVVARCEASAKTGPAMTMGIYDSKDRKSVAHRRIDMEQCGDGYEVFDLGTHPLRSTMYFWVAPPKRPGEVDAVWVDRIFLIRDTAVPAGEG